MTGSQNQGTEMVLPAISQERQKRIREVQNLFHFGWKVAEIAEHYCISRQSQMQRNYRRALAVVLDRTG